MVNADSIFPTDLALLLIEASKETEQKDGTNAPNSATLELHALSVKRVRKDGANREKRETLIWK